LSTQKPYEEEWVRLNETLTKMKEQLTTLEAIPKYVGNNYTEQVLEGIREKNRTDCDLGDLLIAIFVLSSSQSIPGNTFRPYPELLALYVSLENREVQGCCSNRHQ